MQKISLTILLSLIVSLLSAQNDWKIYGTVKDTSGKALEYVNVKLLNSKKGTLTDKNGAYSITIRQKKQGILVFSKINYAQREFTISYQPTPTLIDVVFTPKDEELSEVKITDQKAKEKGLTHIEPKLLDNIPNISGNKIQTFIKTLPGVAILED